MINSKRTLLIASILFIATLSFGQDYDPPGIDPLSVGNMYLQPNDYSRVKNGGNFYPFGPPYRVEYYTSFEKDSIGASKIVYVNNNLTDTVEGRLVVASHQMMNLPNSWRNGYTGEGQKICIFDIGYTTVAEAASIRGRVIVYPGDDSSGLVSSHAAACIAAAIGNPPDGNGVMGAAPDAICYYANFTGTDDDTNRINWAWNGGARVFSISLYAGVGNGLLKKKWDSVSNNGGVLVFASGNDHGSQDELVNPLALVKGSVSVGGLVGGLTWQILDSLFYRNVLPWSGSTHTIDVALPYYTHTVRSVGTKQTGPEVRDIYNTYGPTSGTSFSAPKIGGAYLLEMERLPHIRPSVLKFVMKRKGTTFTSRGVSVTIPRLQDSP